MNKKVSSELYLWMLKQGNCIRHNLFVTKLHVYAFHYRVIQKSALFSIPVFAYNNLCFFFHQTLAEWWKIMSVKSDRNCNIFSDLVSLVDNTFYPGASMTRNYSNMNIKVFNELSNYVSRYAPGFPSYIVLQRCKSLGSVVTNPFLDMPTEKVIGWVEIRSVGGLREVSACEKSQSPRKYREICSVYWCTHSGGSNLHRWRKSNLTPRVVFNLFTDNPIKC